MSAFSGQAGGNLEIAHVSTLAAPDAPTAALVDDEPSGSGTKRRTIHVDTTVRDLFLDISHQSRTERRWSMQQCLCEVRRLCPGMFDAINPNTLYRWKRSTPAAAPLGRITLLSPTDVTRLSEHMMRVSDVLCFSAVTIRSLVHDWLEAEGHDVRPSTALADEHTRCQRRPPAASCQCIRSGEAAPA